MKKIISTTITICVACVLIVFVAINVCIPVYARTIPFLEVHLHLFRINWILQGYIQIMHLK